MRITALIATAGVAGLSRFPCLKASITDCLAPDGTLDEAKMRRALDCELVQFSSKDTRRTLAFSLEYLKQMESVVVRLAQKLNAGGELHASVETIDAHAPKAPDKGVRTEPQTPGDRSCERRMKRGYNAFCRTDVTDCADGIHVKLTVQNPRGVVGHTEHFAREYAVMCARILLYLRANITTTNIVLIEGEGAQGVYAEAAELDRNSDLAEKRALCRNRTTTGYCSPICPDCPLYEKGRCKEP